MGQECWKHGPASVCPCEIVYETEQEYQIATLRAEVARLERIEKEWRKFLPNENPEVKRICQWGENIVDAAKRLERELRLTANNAKYWKDGRDAAEAKCERYRAVIEQVSCCGIQYRDGMSPSDAVLVPSTVYDLARAALADDGGGDD